MNTDVLGSAGRTLRLLAGLCLLGTVAGSENGASDGPSVAVPLHIDAPLADDHQALLAAGGVPFPVGTLASVKQLGLSCAGTAFPCQVTRMAQWPDGSVKWALVEAVIAPSQGPLTLTMDGAAPVVDPIVARMAGQDAVVDGGGVHARITHDGGGVIDALELQGRTVISAGHPAELVVATLRVAAASDAPPPFPTIAAVCRDPHAITDASRCVIDAISVEAPGPVRATILIRGRLLLPHLGETLPDRVKQVDPAGELPFSMRVSFIAGTSLVVLQHQLIYPGEPDRDVITHWGIRLPGLAGAEGRICLEPGIVAIQHGANLVEGAPEQRCCWAPLNHGVAVIRHGWENRPCGIRMHGADAWLECWPQDAGVLDLRRYAREWSVGETGDTKDPAAMVRYAALAARGMAKSMEMVLDLQDSSGAQRRALSLSGRALLVAPPGWYAASNAVGPLAPVTVGTSAAVDAIMRRHLDYQLHAQDLYNWYGTLVYGNWQSRFGQVHRNDRWDCDYGRWGWGLGDGDGRIGHVLMQEFLRTLDRRYFDAGEAFNRIVYDTTLVHTHLHLENAGGWWTALGCSHRHNVQPFGCPYIGMRGSYPVGQRLLYLLTGDGVIADGLELVSAAASAYAHGDGERLCDSGGGDGQGAAACALLWKYEVTGEPAYLAEVRGILDRSGLLPPKDAAAIGYGDAFGLYLAASELATLTKDKEIEARLVATARICAQVAPADALGMIQIIAEGARISRDPALRQRLEEMLGSIVSGGDQGLDDLPAADWPGHAGYRVPALNVNLIRDLPWVAQALGVASAPPTGSWPAPSRSAAVKPAQAPASWYRPGGEQGAHEQPMDAAIVLAASASAHPSPTPAVIIISGQAHWHVGPGGIDQAELEGAQTLRQPVAVWVDYLQHPPGDGAGDVTARVSPTTWSVSEAVGRTIISATAGGTRFVLQAHHQMIDGVPALHLDLACHPDGRPVVAWGLSLCLRNGEDRHARLVTTPGRFRLERCRLDQNDERVPNWLSAEYKWGEGAPLWPLWRFSGIELLPGPSYRDWRANRADTAPVVCDQGFGPASWLDFTDRSAHPGFGLSARLVRSAQDHAGVRVDLEREVVEVQLRSDAQPIQDRGDQSHPLSGSLDLVLHDGWRPPFSHPELSRAQFQAFVADLDYDENTGLAALRFSLSITHKVTGAEWWDRIRDLGIEPREILYQMQFAGGLKRHCQRLHIPWEERDVEGCVQRIIAHYRSP